MLSASLINCLRFPISFRNVELRRLCVLVTQTRQHDAGSHCAVTADLGLTSTRRIKRLPDVTVPWAHSSLRPFERKGGRPLPWNWNFSAEATASSHKYRRVMQGNIFTSIFRKFLIHAGPLIFLTNRHLPLRKFELSILPMQEVMMMACRIASRMHPQYTWCMVN